MSPTLSFFRGTLSLSLLAELSCSHAGNDVENTSHAWLDFEDAEGAVVAYEPEGPAADDGRSARSACSLMNHIRLEAPPQTSFSSIEGTPNEVWESQQPDWPTPAARSLKDELEPMCAPPAHADKHAQNPTTISSLVVRNPSEDFDRRRECQDRLDWPCSSKAAQTTRDDLLPSGSLRYSGYPSAEKYEVLERAVTALEPTWADAHLPAAHQSRMTLLHEAKLRIGGASDCVGKLTRSDRARKPVLRISEDDDPGLAPSGSVSAAGPYTSSRTVATTNLRRRRRALRRLDHEASLRKSGQELILHRDAKADSGSTSDGSSTSSDFDMLEHSLRRRSDYQPMDRLSRLRPSALVGRAVDSAGHHVLTLFTWLRFMILLSTAVVFAIWQYVTGFVRPWVPSLADLDHEPAGALKRLLACPAAGPGSSNELYPLAHSLYHPFLPSGFVPYMSSSLSLH